MPILTLKILLSPEQFAALERLAEHELRTPKAQAEMIIRKALDPSKNGQRFAKNHAPIEADSHEAGV
jgi:hypothetical protein